MARLEIRWHDFQISLAGCPNNLAVVGQLVASGHIHRSKPSIAAGVTTSPEGEHQQIIVDKESVRLAQEALNRMSPAQLKADGVFGPATFAAVEAFEASNGMRISGLLTRNTYNNITRAAKFAGAVPTLSASTGCSNRTAATLTA